MAQMEILDYSHPALRSQTEEVHEFNAELKRLVTDMYESMEKGFGVGLAAPQVGVLKRVFVYDVGEGPHAVVNPRFTRARGEEIASEGCLSIPRLRGDVPRAERLTAVWQDETGKRFRRTVEGLTARVFQHENDHLYGILFTDKVIPGTLHMIEESEEETEPEAVSA